MEQIAVQTKAVGGMGKYIRWAIVLLIAAASVYTLWNIFTRPSEIEVPIQVEGIPGVNVVSVIEGQTAMAVTLARYDVRSVYYPEWNATYIQCINNICETETEWWTLWQEVDGQLIASPVGADLLELGKGASMVWLLTGANEVPVHSE